MPNTSGLSWTDYTKSIFELAAKIEGKGIHNLKKGTLPGDFVFNTADKNTHLLTDHESVYDIILPTSEDCEEFLREHLNMFIVSLDRKFNPNENDWSGNIVLEIIKFGVKDGEDLKTFETPFSDLRRAMVYLISELV